MINVVLTFWSVKILNGNVTFSPDFVILRPKSLKNCNVELFVFLAFQETKIQTMITNFIEIPENLSQAQVKLLKAVFSI